MYCLGFLLHLVLNHLLVETNFSCLEGRFEGGFNCFFITLKQKAQLAAEDAKCGRQCWFREARSLAYILLGVSSDKTFLGRVPQNH